MSGRCKACDDFMSEEEMRKKDMDGYYLDLCFRCIDKYNTAAYSADFDDDVSGDFYKEGRRSDYSFNCDE